jgi:hypothetical protein
VGTFRPRGDHVKRCEQIDRVREQRSRKTIAAAKALVIAALLPALASACSKSAEEHAKPEPRPPIAVAADEAETGEPDATGETGETVVEEVIEIASSDNEPGPNTVPVTPVTPEPLSVPWREVASPREALEFIYVATGVIARSDAGIHDLDDDGRLVLRPGLELPPGSLLGHWPEDVWLVEATPVGDDRFGYRVLHLDPKQRRWEPQRFHGKERWFGEPLAVRKGWLEGLLIREGTDLTRLGSSKRAPKLGIRMAKKIVDVIESSSGRSHTVSSRKVGLYVQGHCKNLACVNETAKKLPFGNDWSFSFQVPRLRHSLSMAATAEHEGTSTHYLLHFEIGGWKLEPMVRPPSGLWANAEGGLWALVDAKLLYRSPHGDWYAAEPPAGAGEYSVALREDAGELWLATTVAGRPKVFATAAVVEGVE